MYHCWSPVIVVMFFRDTQGTSFSGLSITTNHTVYKWLSSYLMKPKSQVKICFCFSLTARNIEVKSAKTYSKYAKATCSTPLVLASWVSFLKQHWYPTAKVWVLLWVSPKGLCVKGFIHSDDDVCRNWFLMRVLQVIKGMPTKVSFIKWFSTKLENPSPALSISWFYKGIPALF